MNDSLQAKSALVVFSGGQDSTTCLYWAINQFDAVYDPLFKTKLGQPLVNYTLIRDTGYYELFILPYFRERTSPGKKGRLR